MPTLSQRLGRNPDVLALLILWLVLGLGGMSTHSNTIAPVRGNIERVWEAPVRHALDRIAGALERQSDGDCLLRLTF